MENNKTEQVDNVETPNVETEIKKKQSNRISSKALWKLVLATALGFLLAMLLYKGITRGIDYLTERNDYYTTYLSEDLSIRNYYYRDHDKYVLYYKKHKLADDILWVTPSLESELAVVARPYERGYINIITGKMDIPFQYRRAWIFSEGIAAVADTAGIVSFIDEKGNTVCKDNIFFNDSIICGIVVHNSLCAAANNEGKIGIFRVGEGRGEWVVEPKFNKVDYNNNKWILHTNDSLSIFNTESETILPIVKGKYAYIINDKLIVVAGDNEQYLYNLDKPEEAPVFVYDEISKVLSEDDYEPVGNLMKYTVDGGEHYGLMTLEGTKITKPIYNSIYGLTDKLFNAQIEHYTEDYDYITFHVLLNEKGVIVK